MAAQLHIIDDTALRDDARLAPHPLVRQPCGGQSTAPLSSSTVRRPDPRIAAIDRRRHDSNIGHEKFAQLAGISFWTWRDLRLGNFAPTDATLKKLNGAFDVAPARRPRSVVKAFHRLVMIEIARAQEFDVAVLLATDFTVQRPHVPEWLAASRIQSMALYITAVELEVGNAELARALRVSREAVRKARNKVEDLRDDAAIDELLNRVAQQVRG